MRLQEYINREMSRPYIDGETDCCNTADRWVLERLGFSPLTRYGRPVRCQQDVDAWLAERWGIVGGVLRVMHASGLPKTSAPKAGDVGLVHTRKRVCMAVFTGTLWFSRDRDGIILASRQRFIRAWSV